MLGVCIIGSGNVARAFAERIAGIGELEMVGIAARNARRRAEIASGCGVREYDLNSLPAADLYIVAVRDDAISEVCKGLDFATGAVVVHTAGCVPVSEIDFPDCGVIYPLQSFSVSWKVNWDSLPLLIEWTTDKAADVVERVAGLMSGSVRRIDSRSRANIHLAAVFANNFSNMMYVVAQRMMCDAAADFDLLIPMISQSVGKLRRGLLPAQIQSGPALRGDCTTMSEHCRILHDRYPEYEHLYETLSQMIWETLRKM